MSHEGPLLPKKLGGAAPPLPVPMTSLGRAYSEVWGICGMPTPRVQGEMSRLGVLMKGSDWFRVRLLAAPGTWVRVSLNLWRASA